MPVLTVTPMMPRRGQPSRLASRDCATLRRIDADTPAFRPLIFAFHMFICHIMNIFIFIALMPPARCRQVSGQRHTLADPTSTALMMLAAAIEGFSAADRRALAIFRLFIEADMPADDAALSLDRYFFIFIFSFIFIF